MTIVNVMNDNIGTSWLKNMHCMLLLCIINYNTWHHDVSRSDFSEQQCWVDGV